MIIGSSFIHHWGQNRPPRKFINGQLANGIAKEVLKHIESGVFKVDDSDPMNLILKLDIKQV